MFKLRKNKIGQAEFPVIKTFLIILLVSIFFIWELLMLFQIKSYHIDEKKINTQLVINKVFSNNCLLNKNNQIVKKNFIKNVEECFNNVNENILIRISLNDKSQYINNKKNEFTKKANLCSYSSNILCTQLKYPVQIINENNKFEQSTLLLQIITT